MKTKLTTSTELLLLADAEDPHFVRLDQLIELAADGKPPTEFCLLAAGESRTTKGSILCDEAHAAMCLADERMPKDGLIPFDYDHGMVSFLGGEKKAAGWAKLSNRNGSLWLSEIKFTPAGSKSLSDREYRYFSPALYRDEEGYVTRIVNVALTNLPASIKQTPLVASETPAPPEGKDMTLEQLCAAFGVANATQLAAKFQALSEASAKALTDNAALVTAAQTMQGQIATLQAAVNVRTAADAKAERGAYITQLSSDGKLPPAMLPWAETQTLDQLKAYGAVAPVVAAVGTAVVAKATDPTGAAVELSAEELAVCSQMKISPKEFAAQKAVLASQANPMIFSMVGVQVKETK